MVCWQVEKKLIVNKYYRGRKVIEERKKLSRKESEFLREICGEYWVSTKELANRIGIPVRRVRTLKNRLEEKVGAGFIDSRYGFGYRTGDWFGIE